MKLPTDLQNTCRLEPGLIVRHKNIVGVESYGVIVSEVAGTYQVAYPSRVQRKVLIVPLEEFAPFEEIGVPQDPDLQASDKRLAARRALALKDQSLSILGSNTAEFLSLCLHGGKETHHIDRLKRTLRRAVITIGVIGLIHDVGAAIGGAIRRDRRRR